MTRALIVVDVQNDFCEGGSLAVDGGAMLAGDLSTFLAEQAAYDYIVATRDYHIDPGAHFSDEPDYVRSWPPHCRAGTSGASFHPALNVGPIGEVFSKGQFSDGYSGFEGESEAGEHLAAWLRARDVTAVDIVGIATDHCVRATSLDGAKEGFATRTLLHYTAGVAKPSVDKTISELREAGVDMIGEPRVA